jgi:hypothetical protein
MGGFGSMSSMIASIKENRALGHRKKTAKDAPKGGRVKTISDPMAFNEMSPEARADHRKRHILKRKRIRIQSIVMYSIIVLLTLAFFLWVVNV